VSVVLTVVAGILAAAVIVGSILRFAFNRAVEKEKLLGSNASQDTVGGGNYGEGNWAAGFDSCGGGDGD